MGSSEAAGVKALRGLIALVKRDAPAAHKAISAATQAAQRNIRHSTRLEWAETYLSSMLDRKAINASGARISATRRGLLSSPSQRPLFVLLDHKSSDYTHSSKLLDDYLWTLAVLRHLMSVATLDLKSVGLHPLLSRLKSWRSPKEESIRAAADLVVLDRDSLWAVDYLNEKRTIWAVLGGRILRRAFGIVPTLPLSEGVEAIIVDLELEPIELELTAIEWLRRFQPIGCRDQATAERLLNRGIEAFVSTSLVATLPVIDAEEASGVTWVANKGKIDVRLRTAPIGHALLWVLDAIEEQSKKSVLRTITSGWSQSRDPERLPVDEREQPLRDQAEVGTAVRGAKAADISAWLIKCLSAAASGLSGEQVRIRWRQLTLPAVRRAQADLEAQRTYLRRPTYKALQRVRRGILARGVTIAFSLDRNYLDHLPTVLSSIRQHTSAILNLVFLTRGLTAKEVSSAAALAQAAHIRVIPMDSYLSDLVVEQGPGKTTSVLDRLFLSELLPEVDRLVYLDLDLILLGDVAELATFEPSARGIAARPTPNVNWLTLDQAFELRCSTLAHNQATRLRSLVAATTDLTAPYFNAGVLVLSLDRLRKRHFVTKALRLVKEFGLNDQDVMNLYAGGDFTPLPEAWNANPYYELVDDAKVVHWAGSNKPWLDRPILAKYLWQKYVTS